MNTEVIVQRRADLGNKPYTVVGMYSDDGSYVEWVDAPTPHSAVRKAIEENPDFRSFETVVAVFAGHLIDLGPENDDAWMPDLDVAD